jgi:hypothetical protein
MRDELCVARVPVVPSFNGEFEKLPPIIQPFPYSFDLVKKLAEGQTTVAGAKAQVIREGVVVRPMQERWERRCGRVLLKCVNPEFLSKA